MFIGVRQLACQHTNGFTKGEQVLAGDGLIGLRKEEGFKRPHLGDETIVFGMLRHEVPFHDNVAGSLFSVAESRTFARGRHEDDG